MEFTVIKTLGEGMFSKTELGETPDGEQIVIKTFPVNRGDNWKDLELFRREEQVLKQLDHPALPKFYGVNKTEEIYQLGYRYIEGRNLIQVMEDGERYLKNELDAVRFLQRMGEILDHLHHFNPPIIHRDLKPANIIVDPDGKLHLIDFGATISTLADRGGGTTVIGTSGYMPPEQLQGQALPASDLYALGATVIYLITGVPPEDLLDDQFRFNFRPHMQIKLSSLFCSLLDQLTDPYLEARFQTARSLLDTIRSLQRISISVGQQFHITNGCELCERVTDGEMRVRFVAIKKIPRGASVILNHFNIERNHISITYDGVEGWVEIWNSWYRYHSGYTIDQTLSLSGELFQLKTPLPFKTKDGFQLLTLPAGTKFKFEKKVNFLELGFHYRKKIPITIYSGEYAGGSGWIETSEENYQGLLETTGWEKIILWLVKMPVALMMLIGVMALAVTILGAIFV